MELRNNQKIPVIMLIGAGHSGSTLIDLIMDSHSSVVGVGELSHYHKHLNSENGFCSCGEKIKNCSFWNNVFDSAVSTNLRMIYRYGFDFLLNNKNFFYSDNNGEKKTQTDLYIKAMEDVYSKILEYSGKKVIFDSSKKPERAELLSSSDKLDVIFLHLVRDGRGVTYSHIKLKRKSFHYMKDWFFTNVKVEIIKIRNKSIKNIFISYEDFVKNPEKVLRYILREIGLKFEPAMLNFRESIHHQPGGNFKLRIQTKGNEIKLDEKWKRDMPLKDKIVFNIFFGWLNLFFKLKREYYGKNKNRYRMRKK